MVKKNTCVFISGYGSNLESLIKRSRDCTFPIKIKLIVTNNSKAKGIIHAKKNSIPYLLIDTKRRDYENLVLKEIKKHKINLICLAGYMKIISKKIIKNFNKNILNVHPSLLPNYKGLNTYERVLRNNEKKTGCTVHYVNEKLDSGKIISKKGFFISNNDTVEILKKKNSKTRTQNFF